MALRSMFLGSLAALLLALEPAGAQTSVMSGGTGGGTAGTASNVGSSSASPTQLVPNGGAGTGSIQRSLSGSVQQGGVQSGQSALDSAGSPIGDLGSDTGPISTTTSPMNAPSTLSGTGTSAVLTPTPMNAPRIGFVTVPPLSGTTVPPLGNAALGANAGGGLNGTAVTQGRLLRSDGRALGPRETAQLLEQLQAQQNRSGAQVIILSGTVFQGTTDRPNVVVAPRGLTARGDLRGLSSQTFRRGQPVLEGTLEAPRVIALAPAPGNVLVVQGSQISPGTEAGQIRAQIVELPAQ